MWLLKLWIQKPSTLTECEVRLNYYRKYLNPRKNKSPSRQWFLSFSKCRQHHLESTLRQIFGSHHRGSDLRGHGWGLRRGVSNKVTAGPGEIHFENH